MITKELAKELLEDLGFNVSNPLQYFQNSYNVDSIFDNTFVYACFVSANSTNGISNMLVSAEFILRGNTVNYCDGSNGNVAIGQSDKDSRISAPNFCIFDDIKFSIESGSINVYGYRMRI
jgi:hypothetical protein